MTNSKERVLVVPRTVLEPNKFSGSFYKFYQIVSHHLLFMDRDVAECNPAFLQLIPYIVALYEDELSGKHIFIYERLKKGTEDRLHCKYSVGIGGHINEDTDHWEIDKNLIDSFRRGAEREFKEEVITDGFCETLLKVNPTNFLMFDDTNDVGKVHLGVLMTYTLSNKFIEPKETNKISGKLVSIDILKEYYNNPNIEFENWSKEAIKCLNLL